MEISEFQKKEILKMYGNFILVDTAAKLFCLKKETFYKKLRTMPNSLYFKQKGVIIIDLQKFLDYFLQ
ncbi:MAG: hypothetical protein ACRCZI_15790 [Cetobacterium sp.]